MEENARTLYLDLMKKTLSFALWREPGVSLDAFAYSLPWPRRMLAWTVAHIGARFGLNILRRPGYHEQERIEGRIWPLYADTMIGLKRLDNLQWCVERVLAEDIPGDLLEAGVWRGGACILMRAILAAHAVHDRRVWVVDSFQGLPKPDVARYPQDQGDTLHTQPFLAVPRQEVEANFARYGLLDDQVIFVEGWFQDTLPAAPVDRLAILRLDGDMYGSTMEALVYLYDKLSPGGYCIVDDYALTRCRQAVDDFCREHAISSPIIPVDWTGIYWRKE